MQRGSRLRREDVPSVDVDGERQMLITGGSPPAAMKQRRVRRRRPAGADPAWPGDHLCCGCFNRLDTFTIQAGVKSWLCLTCTLRGQLHSAPSTNPYEREEKQEQKDEKRPEIPPEESHRWFDRQGPTTFAVRFTPNFFHPDNGRRKNEQPLALDERKARQLITGRWLPGSLFVPLFVGSGSPSTTASTTSTTSGTATTSTTSNSAAKRGGEQRGELLLELECDGCRMYPLIGLAFHRSVRTADRQPAPRWTCADRTFCIRCFLSHLVEAKSRPQPAPQSQSHQARAQLQAQAQAQVQLPYVQQYQWYVRYAWLPDASAPLYRALPQETAAEANATEAKQEGKPAVAPGPADTTEGFAAVYMRGMLSVANAIVGRLWSEKQRYRREMEREFRWTKAVLDLSMAAFGFGHSFRHLGHGESMLTQLDDNRAFDGHPCVLHLWKDPRPPCRSIVPMRQPSASADRAMPPSVSLYPDFDSKCPLWALSAERQSSALLPDVVLAGVWPVETDGDLDFLDARMAPEKSSSRREADERCEPEEAVKPDLREHVKVLQAADNGGLPCGCAPPKCWRTSKACLDLMWPQKRPSQQPFVPRNWMPQAVHMLAQLWAIICAETPPKLKHVVDRQGLNVLAVSLEREETRKTTFWTAPDVFYPDVPRERAPLIHQQFQGRSAAIVNALRDAALAPIGAIRATEVAESKVAESKVAESKDAQSTDADAEPVLPPVNDWAQRFGDRAHTGGEADGKGTTRVLLARDRGQSVARQLEPFPYGLYSFQDGMLIDAIDPTAEHESASESLSTKMQNPLFMFLCQWVQTIVRVRFTGVLTAGEMNDLMERVARHSSSVKDERLRIILRILEMNHQRVRAAQKAHEKELEALAKIDKEHEEEEKAHMQNHDQDQTIKHDADNPLRNNGDAAQGSPEPSACAPVMSSEVSPPNLSPQPEPLPNTAPVETGAKPLGDTPTTPTSAERSTCALPLQATHTTTAPAEQYTPASAEHSTGPVTVGPATVEHVVIATAEQPPAPSAQDSVPLPLVSPGDASVVLTEPNATVATVETESKTESTSDNVASIKPNECPSESHSGAPSSSTDVRPADAAETNAILPIETSFLEASSDELLAAAHYLAESGQHSPCSSTDSTDHASAMHSVQPIPSMHSHDERVAELGSDSGPTTEDELGSDLQSEHFAPPVTAESFAVADGTVPLPTEACRGNASPSVGQSQLMYEKPVDTAGCNAPTPTPSQAPNVAGQCSGGGWLGASSSVNLDDSKYPETIPISALLTLAGSGADITGADINLVRQVIAEFETITHTPSPEQDFEITAPTPTSAGDSVGDFGYPDIVAEMEPDAIVAHPPDVKAPTRRSNWRTGPTFATLSALAFLVWLILVLAVYQILH